MGGPVRVLALPLYLVTLGLAALLVNGPLLLLTGWVSGLLGFGPVVDGFWWGVLGALVLAVVTRFIALLTRTVLGRE